jgi:Tfp pilus assembly protein PilX
MTGRCDMSGSRLQQAGAALVVALTLIAAVALLAAATVRETIVETAMTRQFTTQSNARLAAFSALEAAIDDSQFPLTGEIRRTYRFETPMQFEAAVTVRFLGESSAQPVSDVGTAASLIRHYVITAEIAGPQNSRHRRRLYRSIPGMPDP